MVCTNRQLSQAQLEAGFEQLRNAGAVQAIRPFSGKATAENLVDYLNREVFPVLKQTRKAVNDVYRPVLDNAPSGNPLRYLFSSSVVAADPTAGFLRLDNADASLATTIRVNESNSGLQNVVPWLDVMAGSATAPLGVVTVFHQGDPTRFARYDLTAMVDQGSYWDLTVTAVEVSSVTPFQDGDDVAVSFIPGVAGSGAGAIPVGGVGVAVSAAGSSRSSGTVVWSNSNNVSFGMNGSVVTASATVASSLTAIRVSAGTTSNLLSAITLSNSNSVSFGLNGSTITADVARFIPSVNNPGGNSQSNVTNLAFQDLNGWGWGIFTAANAVSIRLDVFSGLSISAGTSSASLGSFVLSDSNNVSFGLNGSTVTASATVAATRDIGLVSHIGGNVVSSVSRLAFSNASNVTWSLSTAANAATVIASVAAGGGGGITAFALSNAASSVMATGLTFSNVNGFSFLLSTAAGNAATLSGSYTVPAALAVSAAGASASAGTVVWSNSNNVSFGQAGSTITASATVATSLTNIRVSAGTTSNLLSAITFSNANGITWGFNGASVITASLNQSQLGLVSHVGGNSVSDVTRLAFSNASNVTWSLSTAGGAATVLASVAAGGGGIALADVYGNTETNGTIVFTGNPNSTITNLWSLNSVSNNVAFRISADSIFANAWLNFGDGTGGLGSVASRLNFLNSNGITFGLATGSDSANARQMNVTATYAPLAISAPGNSVSAGTVNFTNFNSTADGVRGNRKVLAEMAGGQLSLYYAEPCLGGQWNGITGGSPIAFSLNHNRPYLFQPFLDPLNLGGADGFNNNNAGVWLLGHTANISNTSTASGGQSFNWTYKLGLYSVEGGNGSRLTLVNSASNTLSRASGTAVQSALHGSRWFVFNQTDWSASSGPLTRGNYWIALMISQNTTDDTRASWIASVGMNMGQGTVGVNAASNASARALPFAGFYTTTTGAFPATIASSHVFTNTSASHARLIPALSVRALNNAAFG